MLGTPERNETSILLRVNEESLLGFILRIKEMAVVMMKASKTVF